MPATASARDLTANRAPKPNVMPLWHHVVRVNVDRGVHRPRKTAILFVGRHFFFFFFFFNFDIYNDWQLARLSNNPPTNQTNHSVSCRACVMRTFAGLRTGICRTHACSTPLTLSLRPCAMLSQRVSRQQSSTPHSKIRAGVGRRIIHWLVSRASAPFCWASNLAYRAHFTFRYAYIAGFLKCATTALHAALMRHQDVQENFIKETHWWTRYRRPFGPSSYSLERKFEPQTLSLSQARNPAEVSFFFFPFFFRTLCWSGKLAH
jgi:hypothetical protein